MPIQKPRGRKHPSHRKTYASIALLLLLGAASLTYAFVNGYLPGGGSSNTTGTTSTTSKTSVTSSSSTTTGPPCPTPPASTNGNVYACVYTSMGSFEVELFARLTPRTVANFINLSESGFYDNLVWWRIEPGFVIQTGDPTTRDGGGDRNTWGQGTSGVSVPFEYSASLHNYEGYLGMASTGAGIGGSSQFYINLANNTSLDGNYAVFGKVVSNMTVVRAIGNVPVEVVGNTHEPVTPVYVTNIRIFGST